VLVERKPDPTDRRGRLVALTDKSKECVDRAVADYLREAERLLIVARPRLSVTAS